jgi:hypothetical protein
MAITMEFKIVLIYWDESDQTFHEKEFTETGPSLEKATDNAVQKLRSDKNVYDVRLKTAEKIRELNNAEPKLYSRISGVQKELEILQTDLESFSNTRQYAPVIAEMYNALSGILIDMSMDQTEKENYSITVEISDNGDKSLFYDNIPRTESREKIEESFRSQFKKKGITVKKISIV